MKSFLDTDNVYKVAINPVKIVKYLSVIVLLLLIFNIINIVVQYNMPENAWQARLLDKFFNFNGENNLPSFFSSLLLFFASILLYSIYAPTKLKFNRKGKKEWLVLGLIFSFLALDESVQIHEASSNLVRPLLKNDLDGLLHWAWVVPYFLFFLAVAAYLFKFVITLPAFTRNLFILSAFLFVGGAIGLELFEGYFFKLYGLNHIYNQLLYCLEELMEMVGVTVFIYALLHYIYNYGVAMLFIPGNVELREPLQTQKAEEPVAEYSSEER
ncbi:multidrug transporter [Pontibacter silvestris]|uniref:Multidrug transporter n=1 Tax=Pontibacter silvestris TaxID=2305183 RepID=A0ABW4X341_9BACT|nr:multidrug transporter [Pontibacter silvestris]MCC9134969.1 multidrug transporter [Pontibacter silvestris]